MAALPKPKSPALLSILLLLTAAVAPADSVPAPSKLAIDAVSTDPRRAAQACDALRALGPAGLEALIAAHRAELERGPDARLRAALDRVAGQYDAHTSRLYWYTDLDQARAEAT